MAVVAFPRDIMEQERESAWQGGTGGSFSPLPPGHDRYRATTRNYGPATSCGRPLGAPRGVPPLLSRVVEYCTDLPKCAPNLTKYLRLLWRGFRSHSLHVRSRDSQLILLNNCFHTNQPATKPKSSSCGISLLLHVDIRMGSGDSKIKTKFGVIYP